jgi:Tfp pilus assembly protein PilV
MGGRLRRSSIADDAGFALIEALVGAVVLIVVAVGTLGAIDRAQKTSGFGKNRSVAAALAEQDQARLRGLPTDSLSTYRTNHTATRTVAINGLSYTVASTVDSVRDTTGGTVSCTNDGNQADYLKLTSTVSANSIKPVTIASLSAPPLSYSSSRGTLVVQVNDGAVPAVGVQGVSVTITGPTTTSDTTNSLGCAVFPFIPAGSYDVAIFKNGYVDYAGTTTAIHQSKTVTGGNLTTQSFIYDAAGSIPVTFETDIGTSGVVLSPSRGYNASAFNTLVPGNQMRSSADINPPVPTITLANLFPFRTAYNTWAGRCAGANPKTAVPNVNWFNVGNIGANDNALVPPGGASPGVTVRQPGLEVRVKQVTTAIPPVTTYQNGASVVITPQDLTCAPKDTTWTTVKNPVANTDGWITKPLYDFGGSIGSVAYDPGVPFGAYTVCAQQNFGTTASPKWRKSNTTTVTVNNAAGSPTPVTDLTVPISGTTYLTPQC